MQFAIECGKRIIFPEWSHLWTPVASGWMWKGEQRSRAWLDLKDAGPEIERIRCSSLGGSTVGAALNHSNFTTAEQQARKTAHLVPPDLLNEAMRHGTEQEPYACAAYENATGNCVEHVGAFVPDNLFPHGYLVVSPDGLVGEDGCIEIKCPKLMYYGQKSQDENSRRRAIFTSHYDQMQLVMATAGRKWCDYVVYATEAEKPLLSITRVPFNQEYWESMRRGINEFFEVIVPRVIKE